MARLFAGVCAQPSETATRICGLILVLPVTSDFQSVFAEFQAQVPRNSCLNVSEMGRDAGRHTSVHDLWVSAPLKR